MDSWQTDNPAGLTDWYWDLGICTQNVTYFSWKSGEPNSIVSEDVTTVENAMC